MPVTDGSTIHVYTNLLQIPVLVLSRKHETLPPISPVSFTVQLGKETPFRPRLVRREDEDPITLAILLDGSSHDALLPLAMDGLAEMAAEHLHPRDRVAVYALDGCKFRRLATLVPASGAVVRDSVRRAALSLPYEPLKRGAEPCPKPVGLWDATEYLARTLVEEPGRRVVLAVTNGKDLGSRVSPEELRRSANHYGVTIFAVAERYKVPMLGPDFPRTASGWVITSQLSNITEGSGGMVLETTKNNLPFTFKHFVELVRGRYILEFQRPSGLVPGASTITVSCGQPHAFIRPAGTSVPVTDPVLPGPSVEHGEAATKTTTPSAPSESVPSPAGP